MPYRRAWLWLAALIGVAGMLAGFAIVWPGLLLLRIEELAQAFGVARDHLNVIPAPNRDPLAFLVRG